jgi:hypothetical protein
VVLGVYCIEEEIDPSSKVTPIISWLTKSDEENCLQAMTWTTVLSLQIYGLIGAMGKERLAVIICAVLQSPLQMPGCGEMKMDRGFVAVIAQCI